MSRALSLLFAIVCYAIFFATFLYLVVFVGDLTLGAMGPKTVDNPAPTVSVGAAFRRLEFPIASTNENVRTDGTKLHENN